MQSRKQSKHENKRLLPEQQIVHPPPGGVKAAKGPKGHQKRSQSNPAIQNHFQQQKFFSRHQSKRPSVQQSPHLQVICPISARICPSVAVMENSGILRQILNKIDLFN